ncbi:MAG TPA: SNF2-related protein, partial [Polyangiaceae bacterium]|nr:SNF2-related protein [Polyangiaceae bacterium]
MSVTALQERLDLLTRGFDDGDWRRLGAIAVERVLGQGVLDRLDGPRPTAVAASGTASWLARARGTGLLVAGRAVRPLVLSASGREPGYALHPELRELVLRKLASEQRLESIALATRALLTVRSVSALSVALQKGQLERFRRQFAAQSAVPDADPTSRGEWLRSSLCEPFDPQWLTHTFGRDAVPAACLVLEESLLGPSHCEELYTWLMQQAEASDGSQAHASRTDSLLAQHAILRGTPGRLGTLLPRLPKPLAHAFLAAARMTAGEPLQAQAALDECAVASSGGGRVHRSAGAKARLPDAGAIAPLISLTLCARDDAEARVAAQRWMKAAVGESNRGAARALRTLLRTLSEPDLEQRRIDVHQLDASAGIWETLILGLTVHLQSREEPARANWSRHLLQRAVQVRAAGFGWLARQTELLARLLCPADFAREVEQRAGALPALPEGEQELVLWESIAPKPAWRRALEKLAEVSEALREQQPYARRVVWFVDMVSGELSRPALQELRELEGWTEGRRIPLDELWECRLILPPEDASVLQCSVESAEGSRELTAEAVEKLVGHPRVVNGARGRAAVEVVRGTSRVQTYADGEHVQVVVEPAGARLGVMAVPESDSRLVVYRISEAMQRVIDALPHGTRVPKAHERELLAVLGRLSENVTVQSPELGAERNVEASSTPCIRFSSQAGAWLVQLGVRPFGEHGRFLLAGRGSSSLSFYVDGQRLRCERDLELEQSKIRQLRSVSATLAREPDERSPLEPDDSWVMGEEAVLELLSELSGANLECALEWPEGQAVRLKARVGSKSLKGNLRSRKGWYIATGGLRLDEVTELSLRELVRAPALGGGRFVRLANGDYVELEARLRRVMAALRAVPTDGARQGGLRIPEGAFSTLMELSEPESGFELDTESLAWLERVRGLSSKQIDAPPGLRATLRPYQVEGYRWLCYLSELRLGACLADDMGLGKTLQILALLLTRSADGPALVIAPTSVCSNWVIEARKFAPSLNAVEYTGKSRAQLLADLSPESLVVCSYTLLQQDESELAALSWGTVVLDEAQFIKNPHSLRAKAAYGLTAKHRVAATGTPVENHLGDLWSIFRFLMPGFLGDLAQFNRRFVRPVERDAALESTESLRNLVKPFVLRRHKREVLA